MTTPDAVVVPAVGTAGSLTAVRSLGRRGLDVVAASEQRHPPSFSSRYCDERVRVPDPATALDGYRDALLALAAREEVGAIVPVREADVSVLANHRAAFAEHVATPWPTAEGLRAVHDRTRLFAAAERAGVAVPETRLLDEIDEWDSERIVKARFAALTADDADDVPEGHLASPPKTMFLEPGVVPDVDAIVERMGHVPISQSYLDGTEYCFRALCRDGDPLVTSQKRLRRGYKYSRGPSVYHEAVDLPGLKRAGRDLLAELEYTGIASVGFIEAAGRYHLLEINPRVPASVPVDDHAGVDYPGRYWDLATGDVEAAAAPREYRPGTASHLLRGELVHLHSVAREEYALAERPSLARTALSIGVSLLVHPRFDVLRLEDPAPFGREAINAVRGLVGGN